MPKTSKKKIPLAQVEGFHFDPVAHAYTLNGKPLHGCTTILGVIAKPALIQWAANMACDYITDKSEYDKNQKMYLVDWDIIEKARYAHAKKKDAAAELGTDVHAEIEEIIKASIAFKDGYVTELASNISDQARQFVQWAISQNVKFLGSEVQMYSEKLWVAGTADFFCEKDGKLYVGDIKTSSAIYPTHFIQASAYAHMAREMGLYDKFHGVIIVNIPKTGGLNVRENYDLEGNFRAFKAALTLHKHLN